MLFVEGAEGAVLQAGHKDHECPRHKEQQDEPPRIA